ncbi:dinitrogenase iron-molybdenum cofactor [Alkalibacter rhizosphaerae]|uniref:Dinitrogenase iron-molybdenum cofactor n=1 Tax=Alkalibacter rhizosphaerae TaxID=2815577 RepID=A0A974XGC0_9FIRM|nr:NifB/NifX family molybdenum-iron cluster-binding protein [Alkalibacter rhizosphaerae]QSX09357.1 dinitrogenase iron-molybdenum cofactor [Alkalibacter rhizosphaerae]
MKIAVASENKIVSQHFGHCETFEVFDVVDGLVVSGESVKNPGHKPGFLPNFLHDLGIDVIIAGGMGGGAIDIFNQHGITVVTGAVGDAKKAADAYANGSLVSSGVVCQH